MSKALLSESTEARSAVVSLFDDSPPILVEVRFPEMGTSPDWYLCHEVDELERIMEKLGPGVEVHLDSVWDLINTKNEICLKK